MSLRILLLTLFLFLMFHESEAKSWRGIVPLKSTRADVERLLGKKDSFGRYEFGDERASVEYREYSCVGAYPTIVFSGLRLDSVRFQREPGPPLAEVGLKQLNYNDRENGVIVRTSDDGSVETVVSIKYLPSRKDESLRCKTTKAP